MTFEEVAQLRELISKAKREGHLKCRVEGYTGGSIGTSEIIVGNDNKPVLTLVAYPPAGAGTYKGWRGFH